MNPRQTSDAACYTLSRDWPTRLIERAARRAPANLTERLKEEWLADLDAQPGKLSRLRFALGCCWATLVIDRDRIALSTPVARAATAQGTIAAGHPLHDGAWISRRTIVLLLISGLHIALIAVIGSGLGTRIVATSPGPMQGRVLTEHPPVESMPPAIGPRPTEFSGVKPEIPLPSELKFPPPPIETFPPQPTGTALVEPLPPPVKRIGGGPGAGFPSAKEFYPSLSRELREEGVVAVRVCVNEQGRLSADPQIAASSGSTRLDAGALALAKAGSGYYRSATEDGQPIASCFPFRIRFALR